MGCPVHIWVPMMAALAPAARIARDRFLASAPRARRPARELRTLKRFAPIAPAASTGAAEGASTTERAR